MIRSGFVASCVKRSFASTSTAASVGFIGLGNMGGPMAANLLKAKHHVTVFDVNPQAGVCVCVCSSLFRLPCATDPCSRFCLQ